MTYTPKFTLDELLNEVMGPGFISIMRPSGSKQQSERAAKRELMKNIFALGGAAETGKGFDQLEDMSIEELQALEIKLEKCNDER